MWKPEVLIGNQVTEPCVPLVKGVFLERARAALLRMTLLCADIGIVSEFFDIFIHWVRALFAGLVTVVQGRALCFRVFVCSLD